MGKKNECHLCGAKLQKGYCHDCGLDVARTRKSHYRLNGSDSISSINGKIVSKKRVASQSQLHDMRVEQRPVQQVKQSVKTAEKTTLPSFKTASVSKNKTQNYQLTTQKAIKKEKKRQRKERSDKRIAFKAIVILIAVIIGIFNLFEAFLEDMAYEEDYSNYYEAVEVIENDPYDMVTRELSDEGDEFSAGLSAGEYIVGVHIPEGKYEITLSEGSGYFSADDYENGIYLWESFGEDEEYEEIVEMQDVRLYQNAQFTISEGLVLDFVTTSGQTDAMSHIENPLTETIEMDLGDTLVAGKDFPAGVYDVSCRDESVWVTYRIPANPDWYEEGYNEYYLWLDPVNGSDCYHNAVFPEGTEITAEDAGAILTPSEKIGSTEYGTHYDFYMYE